MTAAPDPELLALLTLRLTPGLGPRRVEALRRHCGSAQAVLSAPLMELREVAGLDFKALAAIGSPEPQRRALQEVGTAADRDGPRHLAGTGLEDGRRGGSYA